MSDILRPNELQNVPDRPQGIADYTGWNTLNPIQRLGFGIIGAGVAAIVGVGIVGGVSSHEDSSSISSQSEHVMGALAISGVGLMAEGIFVVHLGNAMGKATTKIANNKLPLIQGSEKE